MPEIPVRKFIPVSIAEQANTTYPDPEAVDIHDKTIWEYEIFQDIPFKLVPQPDGNTSIGFAEGEAYDPVIVEVNQQAGSLYFLHTGHPVYLGNIILEYEDETEHVEYITGGKAGTWWTTEQTRGNDYPTSKRGWRSYNHPHFIALYVYGLNNPHPDKTIRNIRFEKAGTGSFWNIMGITLCDTKVFFMPSIVSHGIPDNWGAAAVVYALMEGLAGIKDHGVAYDRVTLAPRWESAGIRKVKATARYEASNGYLAYEYEYNQETGELVIDFTGSAREFRLAVLIPKGQSPVAASLNGESIVYNVSKVESSSYLNYEIKGIGKYRLKVKLT
jgi:hypothetical protein